MNIIFNFKKINKNTDDLSHSINNPEIIDKFLNRKKRANFIN